MESTGVAGYGHWGTCPLDFQQFIFMVALCNRAGHYIFCPVVSIFLFFLA